MLDIPAHNNSVCMSLKGHQSGAEGHVGNLPWSIWYATNAAATWERSALRATSFALPLALDSLGMSAAARIPMMTMTISISINVNHLFLCVRENINCEKMVKHTLRMLYRYEITLEFQPQFAIFASPRAFF